MDIQKLISSFSDKKILIVGDVMIDAYLWGDVNRISPEAPVPIVACTTRENRLGGAANVAINVKALGAEAILCSVVGKDEKAKVFFERLRKHNLPETGIITDAERPTTVKTRVISANQHLLRVDEEITDYLSPKIESLLVKKINYILDNQTINCIIFEDYDKGVISEKLINAVTAMAQERQIPTLVDPKKRNFLKYRAISLFKPNLKELAEGLKLDFAKAKTEHIVAAARTLIQQKRHQAVLVTLSEKGILYVDARGHFLNPPSKKRDIVDVSGAGDTVISVAALCMTGGANMQIISRLSNLAGGIVCEKVGVIPINKNKLLEEAGKLD